MPANCVWLDGIASRVTEKFLGKQFSRFGPVNYAIIDRCRGLALVYFDTVDIAMHAVKDMRGRAVAGINLQVRSISLSLSLPPARRTHTRTY